MDFRLPIPKNWQDFESVCQRLWIEIWNDPNAQKNGRQGQKQSGVDISGIPIYSKAFSGVQCKDKDGQLGSKLKAEELKAECNKAKSFLPAISSFTLATTSPRDASIQRTARQLTTNKNIPFDVQVWSWDDIQAEIAFRPSIMETYYQGFIIPQREANSITLNRYSPKEQFFAYFQRPNVNNFLSAGLKEDLISLVYELRDNAYLHGKATSFDITVNDGAILFKDNGKSFNPLINLNASLANTKSNIGSFVFNSFLKKYDKVIELHYSRLNSSGKDYNSLELRISGDTTPLNERDFIELHVDWRQAMGRESARAIAASASITDEVKEVIWTISLMGGGYAHSFAFEFINAILARLNENQNLIVSLPRNYLFDNMEDWFNDKRVKFITR